MDRRTFLKTTAAAGLGAGIATSIPGFLQASGNPVEPLVITILHTNDTHARIDPFPSGQYEGMGGVTRRAALVREIRRENPNTLLLDAGDVFQGTPYFNFYKGKLDFDVMSQMRYDAGTLGNHEFDNGIDGFLESAHVARFPFLNSNYAITHPGLREIIHPYTTKTLGGVKVGIFGVGIELSGLVSPPQFDGVRYQDPVAIAREMVQELRHNQGCQLVICLSHIGYAYPDDKVSDRVLATQVKGIDFIVGGHTHTFLEEPEVFTDDEGHQTIVNQVGFAGIYVGRVDFVFNRERVWTGTRSDKIKIF